MKNPTTSSDLPYISEGKYLPPEIWTLILSKLPAQTLLKFRCVCKSWCFTIDDPDFVQLHFQLSQINSRNNKLVVALEDGKHRLTVRDAETLRKISCIFSQTDRFDIIGSCNGLLLVGRHGHSFPTRFRLWNPSIRKSLLLPACPLEKYNCLYLFGFAPDSQEYKVVAFTFRSMRYAVYTLRNQQWIVRDNALNVTNLSNNMYQLFCLLSTSVFFRGATYWLEQSYRDSSGFTHLVSFAFDEEKISFLKLPFSFCLDEPTFMFLFLLGESLAIFSISATTSSIWVLQQNNQKEPWILWFSGKSSGHGYEVFFLCCIASRKVFYCESDGGYFVCGNEAYNIASCQVRELEGDICSYLKLEPYLESLVLLKGYGARDLMNLP